MTRMAGQLNSVSQEFGEAKRVEEKPRYDLIELDFIKRLGQVLARGAKNYGTHNWQKGDAVFVRDCYNHAIEHLGLALAGDTAEDHFMHAVCNLYFISWYQTHHPELMADLISRPPVVEPAPTPAMPTGIMAQLLEKLQARASASN